MKAKFKIILMGLLLMSSHAAFAQIDDDIESTDYPEKEQAVMTSSSIGLSSYQLGDGFTFISKTDSYKINLSGYLQSGVQSTFYSGDNEFFNRYRVRRARVRLNGTAYGNKVRYRLGVDLVKGSEGDAADGAGSTLSDAWIQYRPFGNGKLALTFGQRSTPSDNKELLMSTYSLQLVERSKLSSIFGTVREVGFFAEGSYKIGTQAYIRPSVAITDGSGSISAGTRYSGMKYAARVNYLPFGLFRVAGETRESDMVYELSPKLVIGAAYSYADKTSDRRGGRDNGTMLYKAIDSKPNGYDLPSLAKFTADFMFKFHGFSLMGEYVKTWAYVPSTIAIRLRNDGTGATTFPVDADGNNGTGADNMDAYVRNRMMLGSAFNVQGGYMFRSLLSIDARYTHITPDDYSYMKNDLYFNRNNIYEIGLTKYLTGSYAVKIQATMQFAQSNGVSRQVNDKQFSGLEKNFFLLFQLAF